MNGTSQEPTARAAAGGREEVADSIPAVGSSGALPPATVCQGFSRDASGKAEHHRDCPVLLVPGDLTKASHGLSAQCLSLYVVWARKGAA